MNPKSILFISQHNAARTQMAEGLARRIFEPRVKSMSAGTHPSSVDPLAAEVMAEIGIDISDQSSKHFSLITPAAVDLIIVIGEQDITLPALSCQAVMKWPFGELPGHTEPEVERRDLFRQRRNELGARLTLLERVLE